MPPSAPLPYNGAGTCDDSCGFFSADGDCDDGGPGSEYQLCGFNTDCTDCGDARAEQPGVPPLPTSSPPVPPGSTVQCLNDCYYFADGDCDDGGPGQEYGVC